MLSSDQIEKSIGDSQAGSGDGDAGMRDGSETGRSQMQTGRPLVGTSSKDQRLMKDEIEMKNM